MDRCASVSPAPVLRTAKSVSLIIPTLRRPDFLRRCLAAVAAQTVLPTQVLVGVRSDDAPSVAVVQEFSYRLPLRVVAAEGVGVIGSMSSCLAEATEECIALSDDDVELPPEWLETMLRHLQEQPGIVAVGGRDLLQDHPEMRRTEKRLSEVGTFHWYGRMTGNHHRGGGKARRVDILRGSNCLFHGDFLREVGFEKRLRGLGAQVNWELALAFQARRRGKSFFYDPDVGVVHHASPRFDRDSLHRGGFDATGTSDNAFNETFVTVCYAPGFRKWMALAYQMAIGSSLAPGVLHGLRQILTLQPKLLPRLQATVSGRSQALRQSLFSDIG